MTGALAFVGCALLPSALRQTAASLSGAHRTLLDTVADTLIPDTDTPGARSAGVPVFLEEILVQWADAGTRAEITTVLDEIDAHAVAHAGATLQALEPARRTDMLAQFDALEGGDRFAPYGRLKGLILFGYYSSEPGATEELRYELVPGAWHGCIPLATVGRSWAVR